MDLLNFVLQEFLKKEFSEENILFWQACEFFSHVPENDNKQVTESGKSVHVFLTGLCVDILSSICTAPLPLQLSQRAREIYNSFLSSKATTPVNIDSQAQLADDILNAPRPNMFKEQQLQVTLTVSVQRTKEESKENSFYSLFIVLTFFEEELLHTQTNIKVKL